MYTLRRTARRTPARRLPAPPRRARAGRDRCRRWQSAADGFEDGSGARVIAREEGFCGPTEMLGHVVGICVADVARRFGERPGLLHDPLRRTCGPPARRGLCGSRDQRVDDRGLHVLIELLQDGAHGCAQLWRAHGFQRSVDLGVFRRHAMSPAAKTSHRASAPTPCAGVAESRSQSARGEPSPPGIRRRSSIRRARLTSRACAHQRPTRRRALRGRAASGGWPSSIQVDLHEASRAPA